jgi:hypothetical protein
MTRFKIYLKKFFKSFIPQFILNVFKPGYNDSDLRKLTASNIEINQKIIFQFYQNSPISAFKESGFRVHSQFEEDGLILFIFSKIGFTNKRGIEICCGPGYECMLANLILYHGFDALLFDGSDYNIAKADAFFKGHPNTSLNHPTLAKEWLTKDNINDLLVKYNYTGEIDILSMDIDGVDYYLMKAIDVIFPRLVICETNNVVPADVSVTIPYQSDFSKNFDDPLSDFRSVSILGMVRLMKSKGYRLIGHHRHGFNLLFLRNDVGSDFFPEIDHHECFKNRYTAARQKDWKTVQDQPWINID